MTIGLGLPHKAKLSAELYFRKDKPVYPEYLKKIHNWGAPTYKGKYRLIAIYECPDDKLYEAMNALTRRYNFYAQVEGYTFEILPLMSESDVMKIIQG